MSTTPGVTQGKDPAQTIQNLSNPETVASPADTYQRAGYDPVLEEVATVGVSGTDVPPAPPERYIEAVWNNYSPTVDSNWTNPDFAVVPFRK